MERLIITLDGPAGTGKSTVARLLAQRLGLDFLDTGAMYRAVTAACIDRSIDVEQDEAAVIALARKLHLDFDWSQSPPVLLVDGQPMIERLRDADVTSLVSQVAALPEVRQVLVENQRRIGQTHPRLVTEGRDQGSVVFPHSRVKFYLEARPEVRAQRRADQLREVGKDADEVEILRDILERDRRDSHRKDAPLIQPPDAVLVDTSDMAQDDVVDHLADLVYQKVGEAAGLPERSHSDRTRA